MNLSNIYVLIAIVVLLAIAVIVLLNSRTRGWRAITPLAGLAFAFVLAGITLAEQRWLGYSLLGIGVVLAVIDITRQARKK
jgi:uncharacterized membrane protein YwaF